jgi:GTP-dependent phosphoenolpyruvate carboxykinase
MVNDCFNRTDQPHFKPPKTKDNSRLLTWWQTRVLRQQLTFFGLT